MQGTGLNFGGGTKKCAITLGIGMFPEKRGSGEKASCLHGGRTRELVEAFRHSSQSEYGPKGTPSFHQRQALLKVEARPPTSWPGAAAGAGVRADGSAPAQPCSALGAELGLY